MKDPKEDLKQLVNEVGGSKTILRSMFGLALMGVMFCSGFIALGTFIFSTSHDKFLAAAVSTKANVIDTRQNQRFSILTFEFQTKEGSKVVARINDDFWSVYSKGDTTEILYDPGNPKEIMLPKKRGHGTILSTISSIFTTVFLVACLVFWMTTRRYKNS